MRRAEVLQHILAVSAPQPVRAGRMTAQEWAARYMSDSDQDYLVLSVPPQLLTLPCPAGDPEYVARLAQSQGDFAPVVLDSNEKIEARYGGGAGEQAFGRQDLTVLDGKHRVQAALMRGDGMIAAAVPCQRAQALLARCAQWELDAYARAVITRQGATLVAQGRSRQWEARRADGTATTYDVRRLMRWAAQQGHTFAYWRDGVPVTVAALERAASADR